MNVPGIRKALLQQSKDQALRHDDARSIKFMEAVVRVGLRACDEVNDYPVNVIDAARLGAIADILREADVEVSE